MKRAAWAIFLAGALALPIAAQDYDQGDDPDHGVARLSLMSGDVTVRRGDSGEVVAGELNAPLVELDHVLTGAGSRAEVQFDRDNMIRLGPVSEVRIGELRDGNYLVQVAEGTTTFRVRESLSTVEISTPTVSVRPSEKGVYRITVRADGATEITVRSGQAEIFTPQGSEILHSGKTMQARGTAANPEYMIVGAIGRDEWDRWNDERDRDLDRSESLQYTSRSIYGTEDLDGHGRWVYDAPYGNVWVPSVASTWAPYRDGRWSYIDYYGWTWVSDDPWGWAPYHYGSWYSSSYGWAWYPGAISSRYYWRPALVSFFGWGSGGISIGIGGSWNYANIGWVPLAPYEVYRPWYGRGRNTTIVNITNVNIVNGYRNARQFNGRNGVTGINADRFGRGRITNTNYLRATNADLSRAGRVDGRVPFESSRESRRFSDRSPGSDTVARADRRQDRQFATRPANNSRGGSDQTRRGNAVATNPNTRGTNAGQGNRQATGTTDRPGTVNTNRGTRDAGNSGTRETVDRGGRNSSANPGAQADTNASGGWRRFEGNTSSTNSTNRDAATRGTDRGTADRGTADRSTVDRGNTRGASSTSGQNSGFSRADRSPGVANDPVRRQATEPSPQVNNRRSESTRTPVEINRPIVQERRSQPASRTRSESVPQTRSQPAPQVRSEPQRRESAPAPRQQQARPAPAPQARESAPSNSGRRESSGGGSRDSGGDRGGRRR